MPSASEAPLCLLCGETTRLLYPSNVPNGSPIARGELACTSPYLSLHDDIFICRRCGLARSVPPSDVSELEELYRDVEDPEYLVSEEERRADFRAALERIETHRGNGSPGTLLEIGSSVGLFLDEARKRGWDTIGIEPSRWAAEQARARGLEVFNGLLEEFDPEDRAFDVIASWDVWEHLSNPLRALSRAHELLKPGGLVVLTTVNLGGWGARLFRSRWPWFMRMHLHYFTRESLTAMARRTGFEVLDLSTRAKILKLGYVLDRARGMLGPLATIALKTSEGLGVAGRPVRIDLGDILLLLARKPERT